METGIENIANSEPLRSIRNFLASLQHATEMLVQPTNKITLQAQCIKSVADDAFPSTNLPITEVCSLREGAMRLANIATNLKDTIEVLNEVTECSIIAQLKSLGVSGRSFLIEKLFAHFDEEIKNIIWKVLNDTSDQSMEWRVAEECYKQADSPLGSLHADGYFDPLEEAQLEWPYDPDFESEEYYEHENRLFVNEDYAAAFQTQTERRDQVRRKDRQKWMDFWVRVLSNSPDGPTLFYPPASFNEQYLRFDVVPQCLFRTFDDASSGRNDENVIASIASISGSHESSRTDLLALEKDSAAELIHMHLTKDCFGGEKSDDLMSWTSSLLFAVQYAVWRLQCRKCHPSVIKICAVDTREFPPGQFARDTWLLEAYKSTAERDDPAQQFFKFRIRDERFYNGEYLSQGVVNHTNRSCVVSLDHLIQTGLFQLYPEFEDAEGSQKWTKRVHELRQKWSQEYRTTDLEIELASHSQRPEWADKPDEVRRYWVATEATNSYKKSPHARFSRLLKCISKCYERSLTKA
ncbi:hypothetical protein PMIN06_012591 [Paraphaeosphaeria minitans]